ncbi:hypothetical protein Celaphus_00004077 [Cervus elaphus hippelaphus]|uniref:HTH psq-type domain-containing protein n=1 Tax=Cervus elaphus hippelaphus TaxID=46360 RepID=A0A212DC60_CEREH|nr:hypothetical protein Celaphus_00004076 [Cervus elaphus hippelaphus]OWK16418.1 hypothetical protein Celaphus_00004077 [Cervus elaphus hippelaphus]
MPGKRSLNAAVIRSAKRERKAITLDVKLEVLRRFEVGEKLSQIAKALGLAVSTVATIRDNKDKIKASSQIATPLRASRVAVGEVGEADVDQLLQSHDEGLSNEELMQLEQEPAGEEEEGEEAAPALRQLTTRELSAAFSHFETGLQVLTSNSPDATWKLQVSRAINDAISCYRELYSEKERRSKQLS